MPNLWVSENGGGLVGRLGGFFSGVGRGAYRAVGLGADLATAWHNDDPDFNGFWHTLQARTVHRFGTSMEALFGEEELGVGSLVGAIPEGGRSPFRSVLPAIETASREAVHEPAATLQMAGQLAFSEDEVGGLAGAPGRFGKFLDPQTWRRAYAMSQDVSFGQAVALGLGSVDILDEEDVANFAATDFFTITSGSMDAVLRFTGDVDILLGKAGSAARARYLTRKWVDPSAASKALGTDPGSRLRAAITGKPAKGDEALAEAMRTDIRRLRDAYFAKPSDPRYSTERGLLRASWNDVEADISSKIDEGLQGPQLADYLDRRYFNDHPQGPIQAHLIAGAPDAATRESVMRVFMGDLTEMRRFEKVADDLNADVGLLERLRADVDELAKDVVEVSGTAQSVPWAHRVTALGNETRRVLVERGIVNSADSIGDAQKFAFDMVNSPDMLKRLDAEVVDSMRQLGRSEQVVNMFDTISRDIRPTYAGGLKEAIRGTRFYQTSALTKPIRMATTPALTNHIVNLHDTGSADKLGQMLANSGMDDAAVANWRQQFLEGGMTERARVWAQAENDALDFIASDLNLPRHQVDNIRAMAAEARDHAYESFDEMYAARGGQDLWAIETPHGIDTFNIPLTRRQTPNYALAPDLKGLRRDVERWKDKGLLPTDKNKIKDVPVELLDRVADYWRAGVLLTPKWPVRVIAFDNVWRMAAKFGAIDTMMAIPRGLKNLTASYIDELGLREPTRSGRVGAAMGGAAGFAAAGPLGAAVGAGAGWGLLRTLSKLETGGFDQLAIRGMKVEGPFGEIGDQQAWLFDQVSAGRQLDNVRRVEDEHYKTLAADHSRPQVYDPGEAQHLTAWKETLNRQLRTDEAARKILAGESDADVLAWLSTREGRSYLDDMSHMIRSQPEEWVVRLRSLLDEYAPGDDLRAALLDGDVNENVLKELFPETADRPQVHGPLIESAKGESGFWTMVEDSIDKAFRMFGTLPDDHLMRHETFSLFYRQEVERRLVGLDPSDVTQKQLTRAQQQARIFALDKTKELLYDLTYRTELHRALRFISPFFPATQEALTRWLGLTLEKPELPLRALKAWTGVDKIDSLTYEDPTTGDKYLTFPIPEFAKGLLDFSPLFRSAIDQSGSIRMPKAGFNLILQDPIGVGPYVQVAVSQVVKERPTLEDAFKFILPFGPTDRPVEAFLPTWARRQFEKMSGEDDRAYLSAWHTNLATKLVNQAHGLEPRVDFSDEQAKAEFLAQAKRETDALFNLRTVAAIFAPVQPMFDSPYKPYIDAYRELANQDPEHAFDRFIRTYGQEFSALTVSMSKSVNGVPPTAHGWTQQEELAGLISAHPELGSFIVGEGTDVQQVQFSRAMYDRQLNTQLGPGDPRTERELRSPREFIESAKEREGWTTYSRIMDWLDAQRIERGLPSFRVKEAQDLAAMKRVTIQYLAQSNPDWFEQYQSRDEGAFNRKLEGFREAIDHPNLRGRPDVEAVRSYLQLRDHVVSILDERDAAGGSASITAKSNQDLANAWDAVINQMIETDLSFGPVYRRWFERDPLTVPITEQTLEGII